MKKPIVIEGAMECEVRELIAALEAKEERDYYGFPLVSGTVDGWPVIVVRTRIGMINASMLTALLIRDFAPLCVISQGTAGGHYLTAEVGSILVAEELVNMNGFLMSLEDCRALTELSGGEWRDGERCRSDRRLVAIAEATPYPYGRLICGSLGSADFWMHGSDNIVQLRRRYPAVCEDMESFAVAAVCEKLGVPSLTLRAVSNNELTGEDFDPQVGVHCQEYVIAVVRNVIKNAEFGMRNAE